MTELEKAVAKWLNWKPGQKCPGRLTPNFRDEHTFECEECGQFVWSDGHDIPCPQPTPKLGFRLLEAMRQNRVDYSLHTMDGKVNCVLFTHDGSVSSLYVEDELTAITKAAAALAEKDTQ